MKEKYVSPSLTMMELEAGKMFCTSRGVTSSKGIGYGGEDEDGDIVPESRTWSGDDF